jgi:putative SOS response-associated peptidase YedK
VCGRYELHAHPAAIALAFGLGVPPAVVPRYNIAPTQQVPIVRRAADSLNELVEVRWGLVPRWAKNPAIGVRMINARAETAAEKRAFRNAFRRHRCLLPADGFYEWKTLASGKQPVHVGMKDRQPFGLAGLYERWLAADGTVLDTCTIVTTGANALLRPLHDRMPVIIAPADHARWLDPANEAVTDLLVPYPADAMTWHPVSSRVNAVRNDDPSLIEPLGADESSPADGPEAGSAAEEPVQASLL